MNDCARVAEYLESRGLVEGAAPPAALSRHLENCSKCRRLWAFATDAESSPVSAEAEERIRQALLSDLAPVRPLPPRIVLAALFLLIFAGVAALTLFAMGANTAPGMTSLQLLGMLAAIVFSAAVAGFWISGEMAPGEKRWAGSAGLVGSLLIGLGLLVAVLFPWDVTGNLWAGSFKCFRAGFILSIPAAIPVAWLISRGFPASLRSIGAVAGLLAGLVGFLVLHMECTLYTAPHIAVSHLAAPLAGAAAGYLGGCILEALRRVRPAQA